ncbi:MAG: signal peptidase I [Tannerellaceae bacterium]|nr:signal peptidase I [Tannerellaceae bacterium]
MKNIIGKIIDICYTATLGVVGIVVLYFLMQVFVCTSFKIPSDSMEPAILAGDRILVEKWSLGARLFRFNKAIRNEPVSISRMPSFSAVRHNDVVVFNWPYLHTWDTIQMDINRYYVKRCVGLPGDTLQIIDGFYQLRGNDVLLGNIHSQERLQRLVGHGREYMENIFGLVWQGYPYDDHIEWNIKDFGPLFIPGRGMTLPMNRHHFVLYRRLIEWEQGETLTCRNDSVFLAGHYLPEYCFEKNYCFVAGDKVEDSQDSRYWGLLPEDFIVGKAWRVLSSTDLMRNKTRWKRIWHRIR